MIDQHCFELDNLSFKVSIHLIIGMVVTSKIELVHHKRFQDLTKSLLYKNIPFTCRYVTEHPSVHAKVYCWGRGNTPIVAWAGSANYIPQA